MGERIPDAVGGAIKAADAAAIQRLSQITVADLVRHAQGDLGVFSRSATPPLQPLVA